jgi:hypothetical protein
MTDEVRPETEELDPQEYESFDHPNGCVVSSVGWTWRPPVARSAFSRNPPRRTISSALLEL